MYSTADQIYETPLPIKTPGKQDQKVLKLWRCTKPSYL
jgi:hypothetical protein